MRGQVTIHVVAIAAVVVVVGVAVVVDNLPASSASGAGSSVFPASIQSAATLVTPSARSPAASVGPSPEPTWEPAPSVAPARDDVLDVVGQDGVPGIFGCGSGFTFGFDDLDNPTGAEDLVGPEYDALRESLGINVSHGDPQLGPNPTAREVARYDGRVAFLIDRFDDGPWGENGGPYLYVYFNRAGDSWKWAGSGDCQPRAYAPRGYAAATWSLDPDFRPPRPADRVLHILVSEFECSSGRSATGRIGPAYVITDRYEVHIEIVVESLPGGQDCQAAPPTPATLRLPEPVGDRTLRDTNAHIRTGTGG